MKLAKVVLAAVVTSALPVMSLAMPCDSGISCTSKTGRYLLEATVCRYENEVRNISLNIDGVEKKTTLMNYFDGRNDGQPLMIDIGIENLPGDDDESKRKITIIVNPEINETDFSSTGKIIFKFLEFQPGPYKNEKIESMVCNIE